MDRKCIVRIALDGALPSHSNGRERERLSPLGDGSASSAAPAWWISAAPASTAVRQESSTLRRRAVATAAGRTVYVLTTVENPSELYVLSERRSRRLTNLNTDGSPAASRSPRSIGRARGTRVQMWIMKPAGFHAV
jgi:hypothetical protein